MKLAGDLGPLPALSSAAEDTYSQVIKESKQLASNLLPDVFFRGKAGKPLRSLHGTLEGLNRFKGQKS